jgi:hypothetical protein
MEGQIESVGVQEAAESSPCSVEPCGERAAAEIDTSPFCLDRFLPVSFEELQSRHKRLRGQEFDPAATAAFKEF